LRHRPRLGARGLTAPLHAAPSPHRRPPRREAGGALALARGWIDPLSSAPWFDGWAWRIRAYEPWLRELVGQPAPTLPAVVAPLEPRSISGPVPQRLAQAALVVTGRPRL
jgi:hypothetical protein